MSVPVVGAFLARVLNTVVLARGMGMAAQPSPGRSLRPCMTETARKRKLADEIAKLDGESLKYARASAELSRALQLVGRL